MTVLVVPCFDEAARLPADAFIEFGRAWEGAFVFVDDGSRDATAVQLDAVVAALPPGSRVLRLAANQGKGEAVRTGLNDAIAGGAGIVGYWDSDLATPLTELRAFESLLAGDRCDVAVGARVALAGRAIHRRAARHYLGRVFATGASLALGYTIYDTQCGAKLFRVTPALREALARPFHSRWIFDVELLARLAAQAPAARVCEVPLTEWRDVGGSSLRAADYARAAVDLARVYRTRRAGAEPSGP